MPDCLHQVEKDLRAALYLALTKCVDSGYLQLFEEGAFLTPDNKKGTAGPLVAPSGQAGEKTINTKKIESGVGPSLAAPTTAAVIIRIAL